LDELLKILRRTRYPEPPKCSKTFLGTNNVPYTIEKLTDNDSGEFVYFGITENLKKCVNPELHEVRHLQLLFNIDGLPLYKSSSMQFWPILCKVFHQPDIYKPFPVAIY
ncbi:GSCOCG00009735001-RA-CDS, partial [Cotesia congregata]